MDFVYVNKVSILGLGMCLWVSRRFNRNIQELEQNTQEKKLFDPLKAKAQIEVYKEIYNMDSKEDQANSGKDGKKDTALKILQSAQENDIE